MNFFPVRSYSKFFFFSVITMEFFQFHCCSGLYLKWLIHILMYLLLSMIPHERYHSYKSTFTGPHWHLDTARELRTIRMKDKKKCPLDVSLQSKFYLEKKVNHWPVWPSTIPRNRFMPIFYIRGSPVLGYSSRALNFLCFAFKKIKVEVECDLNLMVESRWFNMFFVNFQISRFHQRPRSREVSGCLRQSFEHLKVIYNHNLEVCTDRNFQAWARPIEKNYARPVPKKNNDPDLPGIKF